MSSSLKSMTDAQLVAQVLTRVDPGSTEAYLEIVRRFQGKVYGLSLRMTQDEADAQEITQDTFLNVHRKLESFKGDAALGSWIYRIAANTSLMKIRARRKEPHMSIDDLGDHFDADGNHRHGANDWSRTAEEKYADKELQAKIDEAVAKLPEKYRFVFVLRDVEGMSNEEVADALELTIPTVKSRLHRARLFLREQLNEYFVR